MERLCFMRYSSNIAQTIYVSFTDRLHVGEEVNCVGEMFGHHVRSKCEIGRTYSKFGRILNNLVFLWCFRVKKNQRKRVWMFWQWEKWGESNRGERREASTCRQTRDFEKSVRH